VIRRLLFTYLSFALLILLALEVPLGYVQHRNEQQHAFEQLEHDAEVLAAFVDTTISAGNRTQIDILAHESAQRLGGNVDIVDATGALISSTHRNQHPTGSLAGAADIHSVLTGQGRVSTRTAFSEGMNVMSVTVPIHPGVTAQGAIRVTVPTAALTTRIEHFWLLLAAAGVIVLAAAAVTAVALARWISRPIRALEQATRQVAAGTPPPPLATTTGPPELRRLAVTFAATAHRLQSLIASQRAFIGHASHQLKTPLAAMRLRLENLEPALTGTPGKNLRAALAETDRLAGLVDTLLAMARAEQVNQPAVPVDLADATADRIQLWEPLAHAQNVCLTASGSRPSRVLATPGTLDQIIDNLLSNALRAAPSGSTITLTWRTATGGADAAMIELHVIDEGPGLTAEQRHKAFEPFWRAPGAAKGGTGLGLALVHQLSHVNGGDAALRAAEGTGIDAVITLPSETAALAT
jgi:signal transduction histidine kinase